MERRPGDWDCPQCKDVNYATRTSCRKCGVPRVGLPPASAPGQSAFVTTTLAPPSPGGAGGGIGGSMQEPRRPGDWDCRQCGDMNYSTRIVCRRCSAPRPQDLQPPPLPTGPRRPGDWDCLHCKDLNYATRSSCRRCGAPRSSSGDDPNAGTSQHPPGAYRKPGDWDCSYCSEPNEANASICRNCAAPVPSAASAGPGSVPPESQFPLTPKPGDWYCPKCNDLVFGTRDACRRCATKRPENVNGANLPGDWVCGSCGDLVFASRDTCRRCGTKKDTNSVNVTTTQNAGSGNSTLSSGKKDDWVCPKCDFLIFGFREACRKCGTHRSQARGPTMDTLPRPEIPPRFDYLIALSLEATCDVNKGHQDPAEVIEWSAALVNCRTFQIDDEVQMVIKPTYKPRLSEYCQDLTGLTQQQVDQGMPFEKALTLFEQWLQHHHLLAPDRGVIPTVALVTAGEWDLNQMLPKQTSLLNLAIPHCFEQWINIKSVFSFNARCPPCTLAEMAAKCNIGLASRQYNSFDDCRIIAGVAMAVLAQGGGFWITSKRRREASLVENGTGAATTTEDHKADLTNGAVQSDFASSSSSSSSSSSTSSSSSSSSSFTSTDIPALSDYENPQKTEDNAGSNLTTLLTDTTEPHHEKGQKVSAPEHPPHKVASDQDPEGNTVVPSDHVDSGQEPSTISTKVGQPNLEPEEGIKSPQHAHNTSSLTI